MTKQEKSDIKVQIDLNISAIKKQIGILEEKVKPISPDCSLGRLTRMEALGEQHVNNKVLDESRRRLIWLNNALLRIDKPMFGICLECEEAIEIGRMIVRPESVKCVKCAT